MNKESVQRGAILFTCHSHNLPVAKLYFACRIQIYLDPEAPIFKFGSDDVDTKYSLLSLDSEVMKTTRKYLKTTSSMLWSASLSDNERNTY